MINKLTKLYNTLMLVETKGENTKIMADCIRFVEQLVAESAAANVEPKEDVVNDE